MFKNMKRIALMMLPVVTLVSTTSCGQSSRLASYDSMRKFAEDNYDQYALDTVPSSLIYNINRAKAEIDVTYTTPTGGSDSFNFSFGVAGIHVTLKDQYAIVLSSSLVDKIEQYYSDFSGLAISVIDESPIDMEYRIFGDKSTMITLDTNAKIAGNLLVKLLRVGVGAMDSVASMAGFIPEEPTQQIGEAIVSILESILGAGNADVGLYVMNYLALTISDSSKSDGDAFGTYLLTDKHGFLSELNFNFASSFAISGLAAFKKYSSANPREGDQPIGTEAPYQFTLKGSFDFDVKVQNKIGG